MELFEPYCFDCGSDIQDIVLQAEKELKAEIDHYKKLEASAEEVIISQLKAIEFRELMCRILADWVEKYNCYYMHKDKNWFKEAEKEASKELK